MPTLKLDYLETEIIKYYNDTIKDRTSITGVLQQSIGDMVYYFKILDKSEGTNHSDIIKDLYSQKIESIILDDVCNKNGINDRTLYRYRKKYVRVLECIIELKIWWFSIGHFLSDKKLQNGDIM